MRGAGLVVLVLLAGVSLAAELRPCANACRPQVARCRTECAAQPRAARRDCLTACRARAGCPAGGAPIRTLVYVENECRSSAEGFITVRQSLRIRRRDCEPVTVVELRSAAPLPDPFGACRLYGLGRGGGSAVVAGPLQRVGVTPDSSAVVFEVTNQTLALPLVTAAPEQEGIWLVRADGTGLRKIGPASRDPTFRILGDDPVPRSIVFFPYFSVSPDGRLVAFTDVGPDTSGNDAVQIVTLELATGHRVQVTHLPPVTAPDGLFEVFPPVFVDNQTLAFLSFANPDGLNPDGAFAPFTVRTDGSKLTAAPRPVVLPGSRVIATFQLSASAAAAITVELPTLTAVPPPGGHVREVFLVGKRDVLQITTFGREDTLAQFLSTDGRRVFFIASADPLGRNPESNCQLFSTDSLGNHLHQITRFTQGEVSPRGCTFAPPPGCTVGYALQDPVRQTVVFDSSCDAFGSGALGHQMFAVRQDGSGFRQLTAARGLVEEADGAVFDEQVGQAVISGVFGVGGRRR